MSETRFGRNVLLAAVSWLIPSLVLFVTVPIVTGRLGFAAYGVIALVGAVAGYLEVLDLGLGQGIVRFLAMFVSKREGRTAGECLRTVLYWFGGVGIVGAVAMYALAPWLAGSLLKVPAHMVPEATDAFRIGAFAFAFGMVGSVMAFIPEAFLRYDLVLGVGTTLSVAASVGPAVLVSMGYGLLGVIWFDAFMSLLVCVIWGVIGIRLLATLPREGPSFAEERGDFLRFSAAVAANRVWSAIQAETSKVVTGAAGGVLQTGYFSVPNALVDKFRGLLRRMSTVLLPTASQLHAVGQRDEMISLYERSTRLFYVMNATVTAAIVVFATPFLSHWVGPEAGRAGGVAFMFLALASWMNSASMSAGSVNLALGRPKVNLAFSLVNSAVNLGTVYFFTVWWGIAGTAASGFLAALDVPVFLWYSHRKVMAVSNWEVWKVCYSRTSAAVLAVGVAAWFVLRPLSSPFATGERLLQRLPNLLVTMGLAALTVVAGIAACALLGSITRDDWTDLRDVLRSRRSAEESAGDIATISEKDDE